MYEYVGNLHMHTPYSDGHGTHEDIARAALKTGIDFVVVTDHNIWVDGLDGYRTFAGNKVLLLVGEEIHDQTRDPQKNHLLVYETFKELSYLAPDPQELLDAVVETGGLAFLAHPVDPEAKAFHESDLSWVDWDVDGYAGIELWNYMSEFKSHLRSFPQALYYAYSPTQVAQGPFPQALARWDSLLARGKRVVAIGGADAHAFPVSVGPLKRVLFPYEHHFRTVNTHVITDDHLGDDPEIDRKLLFSSIRRGHCFVGYDLPASTRGFRFSAIGDQGQVIMGDQLRIGFGVTLQVKLPRRANLRLLRNGVSVAQWDDTEAGVHTATEPGAYRAEAHIFYKGKMRGWIFSNPIYITE
jgi:hypothetical protein